MSTAPFTKIKHLQAQLICQAFELSDEASQLLNAELSPAAYLQHLIKHEHYVDAVHLLAYGLPKREAIWWSCLAARQGLRETETRYDTKAIEAAEAWVYRPTEENRQLTRITAEATEYKTAAGWAAIAAFWSGGNISPVAEAIVAPADDLTAKAVSGAVMLAATAGKPQNVAANYQLFLQQGIHIAGGGDGRMTSET